MTTFVLLSDEVITGIIDKETDGYYLVDESTAFGDIVIIDKANIREMIKK